MLYAFSEMMGNMYQYVFGGSSSEASDTPTQSTGSSTPRHYIEMIKHLVEFQ